MKFKYFLLLSAVLIVPIATSCNAKPVDITGNIKDYKNVREYINKKFKSYSQIQKEIGTEQNKYLDTKTIRYKEINVNKDKKTVEIVYNFKNINTTKEDIDIKVVFNIKYKDIKNKDSEVIDLIKLENKQNV